VFGSRCERVAVSKPSVSHASGAAALLACWALLLASLPLASAAVEVSGTLDTVGDVAFTRLAADARGPQAMLAPDLTRGATLHVSAAAATVCFWKKTFATAGGSDVEIVPLRQHECHAESSFSLDATGAGAGSDYVGWYVGAMDVLHADGRAWAAAQESATLASARKSAESTPSDPETSVGYAQTVPGPLVLLTTGGKVEGAFEGSVKVSGLVIHTTSAQGEQDYATGRDEGGAPAGEATEAWLFVTASRASFSFESGGSVVVAASGIGGRAQGETGVKAASGLVLAQAESYHPSAGASDRLVGDFAVDLAPGSRPGQGTLRLEGALESTSMVAAPRPSSGLGPSPAFALVAFGAVIALGSGAGTLYCVGRLRAKRTRVAPTMADASATSLFAQARAAESRGAWAEVVRILDAHVEREGPSAKALAWKARALARQDLREAALGAFEEALLVAVEDDMEVGLDAAVYAARVGDTATSLRFLRLSLEADPFLVVLLDHDAREDDDPLSLVRALPAFAAIVAQAREEIRRGEA